MAFPDPCKTIVGPAVVVIPYPVIGLRNTAVPNQLKTCVSAMPVHNLATSIPLTNGDNAGTLLGIISQTEMGPSRNMLGSSNFFVGGTPVTTMGAPTLQNNQAPGLTSAATQIKLMSMR
ncbi:DUF4150 domain-containing protein [Aquabacter sp. CN5-332]|uniref:DUF4150 domain-containing protein n=1 Tax=Aquabacter sp. CN5-332 TaxID=3156608 RepID=UPI0032B56038